MKDKSTDLKRSVNTKNALYTINLKNKKINLPCLPSLVYFTHQISIA